MRDIADSTRAFERWMKARTDVAKSQLDRKHRKMADGAFPFLRATFYRWVEQWRDICPGLATRDADVLLAVGDIHVENFGVWRNSLGQHVWGVNDFDEACELPFTSDLTRLASSVLLAAEQQHVKVSTSRTCQWIIDGYCSAIRKGGGPFLVHEHRTLRALTSNTAETPAAFWKEKLSSKEFKPTKVPKSLAAMFRASFPPGAALVFGEQRSPGGLGSLGRRRYTALMNRSGKRPREAREAKALVPSAFYWVAGEPEMRSQTATLLQHAIRSPDPYFQVHDKWLIRQCAPDIAKIELPRGERDPRLRFAPELLRMMGGEIANIHLGSRSDLGDRLDDIERRLGASWLVEATEAMTAATRDDHSEWVRHRRRS